MRCAGPQWSKPENAHQEVRHLSAGHRPAGTDPIVDAAHRETRVGELDDAPECVEPLLASEKPICEAFTGRAKEPGHPEGRSSDLDANADLGDVRPPD